MISPQLPLRLDPPAAATFESYWPGPNAAAVAALREVVIAPSDRWVGLSGPQGAGKSHLLGATARSVTGGVLVSGAQLRGIARPADLVDLAGSPLLCLDELDALLGEPTWEEGLFALLDRMRRAGDGLVFAARRGPRELAPALRDLGSRLSWGLHFRLAVLGDGAEKEWLVTRAREIGVILDDRTASYMLTHLPRDLGGLAGWVRLLASASLATQRRITPRLVRDVLRSQNQTSE